MKLITTIVRDSLLEEASNTHAEPLFDLPDTLWGCPTLLRNNLDADAVFDAPSDVFIFDITTAIHQTILQAFP